MKAYSIDLRERIVRAVQDGKPVSMVARTFLVSENTVRKYVKRMQQEGDLRPKAIPGRPRLIPVEKFGELAAQLEAAPDATLQEHCREWGRRQGVVIGITAMHRAIARLGWTRKKRR